MSPDQRGSTSATLTARAIGPSIASTTRATPSHRNISGQSPCVAAISASSASAAPAAVRTWTRNAAVGMHAVVAAAPSRRKRQPRFRLPQSSWQISAERPSKFQLRPSRRKRDLSARETMISGAIQYELLLITTLPLSEPRTGVIAPSMIFSMLMMRVSPCVS